MANILDQSEVDALLAAVDIGDVVEEKKHSQIFSRSRQHLDSVEVRPYDFKRPERVSKDQMRALQTLHESFARNFGASLSGFLRTIVEVKVATCEQMTYSEFISGLPNPTSFNLIESDRLDGQMCLEISPLIIYPIIDRLLGGNSQDLFIPQRPMTLIETRLISNVTDRGLVALSEAWSGVREMKFHVNSVESNPQLAQTVPPNEVVIVIGFEIKTSNRAGTMNLCIPYNVIEPVMDKLLSQGWLAYQRRTAPEDMTEEIARGLGATLVDVVAFLAETTMTVGELMTLGVGDIIQTLKPTDGEIILQVEGENKFAARIGRNKENMAAIGGTTALIATQVIA